MSYEQFNYRSATNFGTGSLHFNFNYLMRSYACNFKNPTTIDLFFFKNTSADVILLLKVRYPSENTRIQSSVYTICQESPTHSSHAVGVHFTEVRVQKANIRNLNRSVDTESSPG